MMDWTDRQCRRFHRLLSPSALLYTEMVVTGAILHGDRDRFLAFDASEHPVALQLGGSDPKDLAKAARFGAGYGYDEINLNCGCPSDRVQNNFFGACLMSRPDLVADCVRAMRDVVDVPVTVKTRIGIDDQDSEQFTVDFVGAIRDAGCEIVIIHARKAWLQGLSPKENREIPPLDYGRVRRIKQIFPDLTVVLNGGLTDVETMRREGDALDGVMVGREAYTNPWILTAVERALFGGSPLESRHDAVRAMRPLIAEAAAEGIPIHAFTRHMLGLFHGQRGGRIWRRTLSERSGWDPCDIRILDAALAAVPETALNAAA